MKQVHFTLQGKGGVGKSFISSLLTQYIQMNGDPVIAIDTDPVNQTLAGYGAFEAHSLELMEGGSLNERMFDSLIEKIVSEDTNFVVDNGAASFIPLSYYLEENNAIAMIGDMGKKVVIHTVVTGGQAMKDTLFGLNQLATRLPEGAHLVVWLNEFFGEISAENKEFEQMKVYEKHKHLIHGIVRIKARTGTTFGKDVQMMLDAKLTFDEIAQSADFGIMSKARLNQVKTDIFDQLSHVI